jgi:hypothetical protein
MPRTEQIVQTIRRQLSQREESPAHVPGIFSVRELA